MPTQLPAPRPIDYENEADALKAADEFFKEFTELSGKYGLAGHLASVTILHSGGTQAHIRAATYGEDVALDVMHANLVMNLGAYRRMTPQVSEDGDGDPYEFPDQIG